MAVSSSSPGEGGSFCSCSRKKGRVTAQDLFLTTILSNSLKYVLISTLNSSPLFCPTLIVQIKANFSATILCLAKVLCKKDSTNISTIITAITSYMSTTQGVTHQVHADPQQLVHLQAYPIQKQQDVLTVLMGSVSRVCEVLHPLTYRVHSLKEPTFITKQPLGTLQEIEEHSNAHHSHSLLTECCRGPFKKITKNVWYLSYSQCWDAKSNRDKRTSRAKSLVTDAAAMGLKTPGITVRAAAVHDESSLANGTSWSRGSLDTPSSLNRNKCNTISNSQHGGLSFGRSIKDYNKIYCRGSA
ncbi:hypothetical protein E2C01_010919 [Portunus trituberculatus]|uniref:Uncharacterized protein n=1 Tax=Portunus trituberculatus TaxID=210409 RepID=A0A5B7D9X0_PORTR|nr:hypothetical protein [Portunus trituberculatus]